MRLSRVLTIAAKELREILRDRRTLLLTIGLPILVYPLTMVGMSKLQESRDEAAEARRSAVAVWGVLPDGLVEALQGDAGILVRRWQGAPAEVRRALEAGTARPAAAIEREESAAGKARARRASEARREARREQENPTLAAARRLLESRDADAVLVAWGEARTAVAAGGLGTVSVYFDSVREDSGTARSRLDAVLRDYREALLKRREDERALPTGFVEALDVLQRDVAPPARQAGRILGSFLPFLLISLSLFGGFYPAVDLTAGEKERGTMQTLLCAPVRPLEIVLGKFLAVWAIAAATALVNISSLALTTARLLRSTDMTVPVASYFLTAVMLVPITFITAALFIAVAVFARDFKDGQNFLTPVYMALVLPAGATMLPGVELNAWTAFVPIVNIALLVKSALIGEWQLELVFLTLLSSAAFAALAMLLAVRVFEREQVLLGGKDSARGLLGLDRRAGGRPTPPVAVVSFAVVMVLAFYASLLLEGRGLLGSLLSVQYGFFLLPALLVVFGLGYSARSTFSLRAPSAQAVAAAVLIGVSAWIGVGGLVMRVAPPPDSLVRALERVLLLEDSRQPLWVLWLVIAITPALCEEMFFRGLVMSGLRSLGAVGAILTSALLFAVAHASIYRLLPTLLLGLILGYAVWKSGSILTSMIIHGLNNGLIATITHSPALLTRVGAEGERIPAPLMLGALALTFSGLVLLSRSGAGQARRAAAPPNGA